MAAAPPGQPQVKAAQHSQPVASLAADESSVEYNSDDDSDFVAVDDSDEVDEEDEQQDLTDYQLLNEEGDVEEAAKEEGQLAAPVDVKNVQHTVATVAAAAKQAVTAAAPATKKAPPQPKVGRVH
jgi:hypothetical protein